MTPAAGGGPTQTSSTLTLTTVDPTSHKVTQLTALLPCADGKIFRETRCQQQRSYALPQAWSRQRLVPTPLLVVIDPTLSRAIFPVLWPPIFMVSSYQSAVSRRPNEHYSSRWRGGSHGDPCCDLGDDQNSELEAHIICVWLLSTPHQAT